MKKLKAPMAAQVEMTNNCNFLCKHCYNYWRYKQTGKRTFKEIDRHDKIIEEIINAEIFQVVITGGEPLMTFDTVKKYLTQLYDNNVDVSMNSNLSLMTDKKAKELSKIGLKHILTSVYSNDSEKAAYQMTTKNAKEKTIEGIKQSVNNGIAVSVNCVIDKNNLHDVYDLGMELKKLGITSFNGTRFIPAVKEQINKQINKQETKIMLEQLLALQKEGIKVGTLNPIPHCFENGKYISIAGSRGCSAGNSSIGIGVDGNVRACQHSDIVYGNLTNESLTDIWAKIPVWKETYIPEECSSCSEVKKCAGGCRQSGLVNTGKLNGIDYLFTEPLHLSHKKDKIKIVKTDDKFIFNNNLKARTEEKGGIIYKSPYNHIVLDELSFELVKKFHNDIVSVNSIINLTGVDKKYISKMLYHLNDRGIIHKI